MQISSAAVSGLGANARSALAIGAAVVLAGCASAAISTIELDPAQPIVCDTNVTPNVCGVANDNPVSLRIHGKGNCSVVMARCGNGLDAMPYGFGHDFGQSSPDQPLTVACKYDQGYPGPKTVEAHSNGSDCIGQATLRINVMSVAGGNVHSNFMLGYGQPGPTACQEVPHRLPLRAGTKVSIRTNPDPAVKINFGCAFGGCVYDADGEPGSSAPAGFAFPGMRKYSLVLRVGQQAVQGGTNMSFVTNQGGLLEVCVNDDQIADNTGAWGIGISIDESRAP
jgi:hypothetical protein